LDTENNVPRLSASRIRSRHINKCLRRVTARIRLTITALIRIGDQDTTGEHAHLIRRCACSRNPQRCWIRNTLSTRSRIKKRLTENVSRMFRPMNNIRDRINSHNLTPKSHRSEEHTSELQSRFDLVCRLLLEKKKTTKHTTGKNKTTV